MDFNYFLSEYRVVVENIIKRIKDWRVLSGTFRHSIDPNDDLNLNLVFRVCCILTKLDIGKNPLSGVGWIPNSFYNKIEEE